MAKPSISTRQARRVAAGLRDRLGRFRAGAFGAGDPHGFSAALKMLLAWVMFCFAAAVPAAGGRVSAIAETASPAVAGFAVAGSGSTEKNLWSQADAMVNRLREERKKLNLIFGDLERLQYMGQDFRDLQLYSTSVTRLGPEDDVKLDRLIERLEKKLAATRKQVVELQRPLDDAFFIAHEMLQESPNADMIELLLKDNVDRINRLVQVQRELNKRWDEAFALLSEYRQRIGLSEAGGNALIEGDFFKVLMANTGRASQRFYAEFNDYKDTLATRTGKADGEKMAKVDLDRIKGRLRSKNIEMVQEDLERLSRRFEGRISIGMVDYYLGVSLMVGGKPLAAAEAYAKVAPGSRMYGPACLGLLQALFDTRQDDTLLTRYRAFTAAGVLDGKLLPSARYLAVQSAYFLGADTLIEAEVLASNVKGEFHFKSLFVYAKALIRQGKLREGRNVLVTLVSESNLDPDFHARLEMTLAHLNFEEKYYETALKGYQGLLDRPGFQAEALYGMVWCNIKMGDMEASEFILKKLISQYPDNPWAMEGFMVLVRKLMVNAKSEWAFRLQVEKELDQLQEFRKKLAEREAAGVLPDGQAKAVREKLDKAAKVLGRQKLLPIEDVARLYQQALGLCDFVDERYKSGEYSDVSFNRDREEVLAKLSEQAMGGADSAEADTSGARSEIRKKLFESRSLALDIHVMHKTWLEDLLKHEQRRLNEEIAALKGDTTKVKSMEREDLSRKSKHLADDISERLAAKADDILKRIGDLAEDPNSSAIMDWLLFEKGYLGYGIEEDGLKKRQASWQWLESQGGKGLLGASEPVIDPDGYEGPWKDLVERYPESQYVPAALYYLGFTTTARGEYQQGLRYFEELARRFPQALYTQQALIFIGEYYFNENKLEKAADAYDRILDFSDSKYFDQALYKLAWTRYRANSYKTAISSFTYILEENMKKGKDKDKAALTTEALQFAALSIAESDTSGDGGLKQSRAFADKLGDARFGAKLLHRMAVIYTQQGKLDRAKRALESLLNGYPDYEKIPEAMMELGRAYEKEQNFQKAAEVREKIFRVYHREGDWYKKLTTADARANADSVAEAAMDQVALHYMYEAKEIKAGADGRYPGEMGAQRESYYRKAISAYDAFLRVYPENKNRAKYNYQQAEAYFALSDFASATKKYMQVSQMPDVRLKTAAAYNAIVAAQEMLKKTEEDKGAEGKDADGRK
jgi:tetratricopeptide (TPR) repeat protein